MATGATSQITLSDVSELNNAYLEYLAGVSLPELQRRISTVSISTRTLAQDLDHAREILDTYGILVVPEAAPEAICANAADAVVDLCETYAQHQSELYEDDLVLYQVGTAKLKGYHQLSTYGKAVINVRQGQDEGMLDVFSCDLALPDEMCPLRSIFEDPRIISLLNRPNMRPRNLNAYVNDSVVRTRGFHVDSYAENLKAFIYLSDVLSLEDGPYTFAQKSHSDSAFRRINRVLCDNLTPSTETPVISPTAITPILAPKGSLVISDQSGSHRGWPQSPGHQRAVAVMKYA